MQLTANETIFLFWAVGSIFTTFLGVVVWILNKGVNKMEAMASSLTKIEKDFGILLNDHFNLKDSVKEIDKRVIQIQDYLFK